jgi:hypothetical protein
LYVPPDRRNVTRRPSADVVLLDPLPTTLAELVRGIAGLQGVGPDAEAAVVVDALRGFVRRHEAVGDAGAVQRYVAGGIPRHRVGELTGTWGDDLDATIREHRERVAGDAGDAGDRSPVVDAVAATDAGLATLVRGIANAGIGGIDAGSDVIRGAVRWYVAEHESLRHAATAARYAEGGMSTGFAAEMADVRRGGEIEALLRDHGVEPRRGSAPDPETRWR